MRSQCPHCQQTVSQEYLNVQTRWGVCPFCDHVFQLREELLTDETLQQPSEKNKRYVVLEENDDVLTVHLPRIGGWAAWLMLFLMLLFFGACILTTLLDDGKPVGRLPFSLTVLSWIVYGFMGGLSAITALSFFGVSQTVRIDSHSLTIETYFCNYRIRRKIIDRAEVKCVKHGRPLGNPKLPSRMCRIAFGKKEFPIECRSHEEEVWLLHYLKAFFEKTTPNKPFNEVNAINSKDEKHVCIPLFCPQCNHSMTAKQINITHEPLPQAECDSCSHSFSIDETTLGKTIEAYPRPENANATVEQTKDTLVVNIPSEYDRQSQVEKWMTICSGLVLAGAGLFGMYWFGKSLLNSFVFYFSNLDFRPALQASALMTICCLLALMMFLMFCVVPLTIFFRGRLSIHSDEIRFEYGFPFWMKTIHTHREDSIIVETFKIKPFRKEQLTLRYWLNLDPVLGKENIRFDTKPHIVIRCNDLAECRWLLYQLNDFLDNSSQKQESK